MHNYKDQTWRVAYQSGLVGYLDTATMTTVQARKVAQAERPNDRVIAIAVVPRDQVIDPHNSHCESGQRPPTPPNDFLTRAERYALLQRTVR